MCNMQYAALYYNVANGMLLDIDRGVFKYDSDSHTMMLIRRIRKRERKTLACLLTYKNMLTTKGGLLSQVWEGRIVSDHAITVAIHDVRKILMTIDPDCRCLETVRKAGYVFSPEKSELAPVASIDCLLDSLARPITLAVSFSCDEINNPFNVRTCRT
ncbi:transcriptional regulator [compost metagenome]